jgi:hypothetical protein
VGVDLGRGEVLVAEQLLDHAQVGTAVQEVGRERVAQGVWRHAHGQAGRAEQAIEAVAQTTHPERRPVVVEEDGARDRIRSVRIRRDAGPSEPALGDEHRPTIHQVRLQGGCGRRAEQADALLAALAQDPDLAPAQVQ